MQRGQKVRPILSKTAPTKRKVSEITEEPMKKRTKHEVSIENDEIESAPVEVVRKKITEMDCIPGELKSALITHFNFDTFTEIQVCLLFQY
jgi:Zn-dependent M32 family carboxypeptidase